jgi:polyisoprenyl-teichoic acid--peptidoglycan teichoic acid transferase
MMSISLSPRSVGWLQQVKRLAMFGVLLAALGIVVPDAGRQDPDYALIKLDRVHGVDASDHVVWILALGSDARPGQPVLGSRSDAIQLVGINAKNHHAVTIGIPRDSYVSIPGHGQDKINAAMVYGGANATADAVANLTGIQPDYVFVTSFRGLVRMVGGINGIRVRVTHFMDDQGQVFRPGMTELSGVEALAFARIRHGLPRGDFDRSYDQGQLLRGGLATVLSKLHRPGFLERSLERFAKYTDTNVGPIELYRLAHTVLQVDPKLVKVCVVTGGTGMAGSASVVFPNVAAAQALGRDVRHDAKVKGGC